MNDTRPLGPQLTAEVLAYLGVSSSAPGRGLLADLIEAYTCRVPWESVSRIARAASFPDPQTRVRWPADFWRAAIAQGTGGTCFESNYAFAALLWALGFDAYLTINDMREQRGCHTAIVVRLEDGRLLADAGFPLYTLVPVQAGRTTQAHSPFHTYTLTPDGPGSYRLERDRHPNPYAFTLIDRPVTMQRYRSATENDHAPGGLFLDRAIITRRIAGRVYRFDNAIKPYCLQVFEDGRRQDEPLPADPATALASHFEMDAGIIAAALHSLDGA